MIARLKRELASVKADIFYMEENDTAWSYEYVRLCKKKRILEKTIKKLERLEIRKNGKRNRI